MRSFLPPYGDGTKGITENQMEWQVFAPLTGMVLYDYQIKGFFKEFSSPYGDGIYTPKVRDDIFVFSPPYGDSTDFDKYGIVELTFSPPYGDGTESLKLSHGVLKFSPPYGEAGAQRLRGFYGDKLKSAGILQNHQRGLVFVPLRG